MYRAYRMAIASSNLYTNMGGNVVVKSAMEYINTRRLYSWANLGR